MNKERLYPTFRKNCASPSSAGQLILPECMKLLPLYTNCLMKSDALSGGRWSMVIPFLNLFSQKIDFRLCSDLGCDDRAFHMSTVSSMDVASSLVYFYPRLIPLHTVNPEETGVPEQIR